MKTNAKAMPRALQPTAAISQWLNTTNQHFSSIVEQNISNKQVILLANSCTAFTALMLSASSLIFAAITLTWFAHSLLLCKTNFKKLEK